jgi:hypothetical protein
MKVLLLTAMIAVAAPLATTETKLGTGVSLKEATPIKALIERPKEFAGRTIRIDGVATAVCAHMGCWMAVAAHGDENGATVRLKVDDGVIVFPVSAKGKKVSAEGVFEPVGGGHESQEAAGEHAKSDAKASLAYHLKATGAFIHEP